MTQSINVHHSKRWCIYRIIIHVFTPKNSLQNRNLVSFISSIWILWMGAYLYDVLFRRSYCKPKRFTTLQLYTLQDLEGSYFMYWAELVLITLNPYILKRYFCNAHKLPWSEFQLFQRVHDGFLSVITSGQHRYIECHCPSKHIWSIIKKLHAFRPNFRTLNILSVP